MYLPDPASQSNGSIGALLSALLYGGKVLQYSKLVVTDAAVKTFANAVAVGVGGDGIPAGARSVLVLVEADATEADLPRVVRFRCDTGTPTAAEGMPCGDNGSFEVTGDNIANFQIIGVTAGKSHTLRITFYGEG